MSRQGTRPETAVIYDGQHGRRGAQALLNRVTEVMAGALDAGYRAIMVQVDEPGDHTELRRILTLVNATRHVRVLLHSASCLHPDSVIRWLLGQQLGNRVDVLTGPGLLEDHEPSPEAQQQVWPIIGAIKGHLDPADQLDIAVAAAQAAQ